MQKALKSWSALLVIALAVIAAIVAVGLIAGYAMQPFIVGYWVVLTAKNILDYIANQYREIKNGSENS